MESKVKYQSMESAIIKVDNSEDTSAVYAMSASVNVRKNVVESVYGGQVKKEGNHVANFDVSASNLSLSIFGVETAERVSIMQAVQQFADDIADYVNAHPIV